MRGLIISIPESFSVDIEKEFESGSTRIRLLTHRSGYSFLPLIKDYEYYPEYFLTDILMRYFNDKFEEREE